MSDNHSPNVVISSSTDFQKDVLESDVPVLVDFWAEWCQPCLRIAPSLNKIADEMGGKIKIVKINIDENPDLGDQYRIMSIPNLKFFHKGNMLPEHEIIGAWPEPQLKAKVAEVVNSISA